MASLPLKLGQPFRQTWTLKPKTEQHGALELRHQVPPSPSGLFLLAAPQLGAFKFEGHDPLGPGTFKQKFGANYQDRHRASGLASADDHAG
jgi:hypothetical protein